MKVSDSDSPAYPGDRLRDLLRLLRKQWFLLVLLAVVLFSYHVPGVGVAIRERLSIKWFIMPTLFLMSLSLHTREIVRSFMNMKGVVTAVVGGYLFSTAGLYLMAHVAFRARQDLVVGIILIGAVPCTLASASIWTRLAGGNDALALAITIVSNTCNFLVAPALLYLTLRADVEVPFAEMMARLFQVIVLPVSCGQVVRYFTDRFVARIKIGISVVCRFLVLFVVLVSVARARHSAMQAGSAAAIPGGMFAMLVVAVSVSHIFALVACRVLAGMLGCNRKDAIAIMFGGSQKTLPVGVYLAETFFPGVIFAVLPMLVYHAAQLVLDSFIVEFVRRPERPAGEEGPAPADVGDC